MKACLKVTKSYHGRKLLERYRVQLVPVGDIRPSPENSEIYGQLDEHTDPALPMLIRSIERLGLEEPLILTQDHYILSGHRRFYALVKLGWSQIPVRLAAVTRADCQDYHRLLAQYNPQRVKSVASVLAETLLDSQDEPDDGESWAEYHEKKSKLKPDAMQVAGCKLVKDVGPRQQEFLTAAKKVIEELRPFWPVSDRKVHYKLLNDPPLTQVTKTRNERWRYRSDQASWKKLCDLLVSARYYGHVPWSAITDTTRETKSYFHYENIREFVETEVSCFLDDYKRDRQEGQPHYVEGLLEKNTLISSLGDIFEKFHIPFTPLRGYGGPSVWREIELRWRAKVEAHTGLVPPKLVLIIVSDHDPEGLDLADDAVRSLRDNHNVDVHAIRPAVTMDQVKKYRLPPNFAKETSKRYNSYVKRTGTKECWECEALDEDVLRQCVHDAIMSVMDVGQLNAVQEREAEEQEQLRAIKRNLGGKLMQMINEGEGL